MTEFGSDHDHHQGLHHKVTASEAYYYQVLRELWMIDASWRQLSEGLHSRDHFHPLVLELGIIDLCLTVLSEERDPKNHHHCSMGGLGNTDGMREMTFGDLLLGIPYISV